MAQKKKSTLRIQTQRGLTEQITGTKATEVVQDKTKPTQG